MTGFIALATFWQEYVQQRYLSMAAYCERLRTSLQRRFK
jgi:hypothetical protein